MRRLLVVCLGFVLLVGEVRGAVAPGDAAARLGQALGAKDPLAVDEALKDIAQEKAGPAPLKVIEEASKSGDANVRGLAAYALTQIDPEKAKAGLPALIEMLKSANPRNRVRATIGMRTLGPAAAAAAPALVGALKDEDFWVRGGAVTALGLIGPAARSAIPALIKKLRDDHVPVRGMTVIALGKFGADARDALPAILEMLKSEPVAVVRKQVPGTLEQIGGTPVDALCMRAQGSRTGDPAVGRRAC